MTQVEKGIKGIGRIFEYINRVYVSNCMGLHLLGWLQHLLDKLHIGTFGELSGMADHTHVVDCICRLCTRDVSPRRVRY